ncbi:Pyrroline-5-carboxylate reductase [subsurface metagenome]
MQLKKFKSIGFVGGGRITRIFLEAFRRKEVVFESVLVNDLDTEKLNLLKKQFPYIETVTRKEKPAECDLVVLALHPQDINSSLFADIGQYLTERTTLLSLAPKVSIVKITELAGIICPVVRMIPNAPSIINLGYNPIAFSENFDSDTKQELIKLLSNLGELIEVQENKLEAYAVITGMGPTYFWFQFEELYRLAVSFGLDEEEARSALNSMIKGSAETFFYSNLPVEEVKDLIPVKPLKNHEEVIRDYFKNVLENLYKKLKNI